MSDVTDARTVAAQLDAAVVRGWDGELVGTTSRWSASGGVIPMSRELLFDAAAYQDAVQHVHDEMAHKLAGHARTYRLADDCAPDTAAKHMAAAAAHLRTLCAHYEATQEQLAAAQRTVQRLLGATEGDEAVADLLAALGVELMD